MRTNRMYVYQEGEKTNSVCAFCEKSVTSTLTNVTLSLCEGLEEVENVLVRICDECGNMVSIPARSLPPIQLAHKRIDESGMAPDPDEITTELKSIVDARKSSNKSTKGDDLQGEPLVAVAG